MALYRNRKEAKQGCIMESNTALRYAEKAVEHAANGKTSLAWSCADNAVLFAKCAMQAHEALWELSKGQLTEDEFEAFEKAEVAQIKARNATQAAADAVAKIQADYDAQKKGARK